MNKNSRWVFTAWKKAPMCRRQELVLFEVWQKELTSDGKEHYQGYVEFYSPYTQTQVKNLYSDRSMHLEEPRESREDNIFYCLKPNGYAGERSMFHNNTVKYFKDQESKTIVKDDPLSPMLTWKDVIKARPELFPKIDYKILKKK